MGLVAAKCTQCGANIEVDDSKEAGICKYCGTAFATEKVINHFEVTNHISDSVVNIYNSSDENCFETSGHKLISYKGEDEIVTVPIHITVIGEMAFGGNCKIKKIILPDSITEIESRAFINCRNLMEIVIPDSIFMIGAMAFGNCVNLRSIMLPAKLRVVNVNLFSGCTALEKVFLKDGIIAIKSECFEKCISLKEITIPKSVKKIEGYPFYKCRLDKIVFENADNIDEITDSLFYMSEKIPEIIASEKFRNIFGKYLSIDEKVQNKNGCYIATCVYGSYDCPQVWRLRRFRDYTLDATWYGRLFIKCYYAISPSLVKWFGETKWFRGFWKFTLDKMVANLNKKSMDESYYDDKY